MADISFTCKILTPMFIGTAMTGEAELRPPAIKGALRFWWRAMKRGLPINDTTDNGRIVEKGLLSLESEIFGSADKGAGRSKVIIEVQNETLVSKEYDLNRIAFTDKKTNPQGEKIERKIDLMNYFTFGMNEPTKEKRKYFEPDGRFVVTIRFDSRLSEPDRTEVINAFYLVSYIGGLGAKSRNGFGRFTVIQRSDRAPHPGWIDLIKPLCQVSQSSYTAFSKDVKIWQTQPESGATTTWRSEFEKIAIAFKRAKSKSENEHSYDTRQYVTLPMKKATLHDRHAKTHFLTIIEEYTGVRGYIFHFPYKFLEGNNILNSDKIKKFNEEKIEEHQRKYNAKVTNTNSTTSFNSLISTTLNPVRL